MSLRSGPVVEHPDIGQIGLPQGVLGVGGPLAAAADQHDVAVQVCRNIVAVLAQPTEWHVVGAGDVSGRELTGHPYVEEPWRHRVIEKFAVGVLR